MSHTSTLISCTEFADHGAIVRVTSHKLHEHESSMLIAEMRAYLDSSERTLIAADFEQVEFISSAALGAMVTMNTELAKRGGRLVMLNLSRRRDAGDQAHQARQAHPGGQGPQERTENPAQMSRVANVFRVV